MSLKKIIACLVGSVLCSSIFASTTLANYAQLLQALNAGNKVRAIVHFDKCIQEGGTSALTQTAGFNFDYYNHYNMPIDPQHSKEVIATSKNIFSIANIQNLGPVNNYVRLHVFTDNTAEIFVAMLDPMTYQQKLSYTYSCPISDDIAKAGVMLYTN